MTITINNQTLEIAEQTSLRELLYTRFGDKQTGMAVAVNSTVVARSAQDGYILQPNDSILIIKATQGG